jgi:hypothetical protein
MNSSTPSHPESRAVLNTPARREQHAATGGELVHRVPRNAGRIRRAVCNAIDCATGNHDLGYGYGCTKTEYVTCPACLRRAS